MRDDPRSDVLTDVDAERVRVVEWRRHCLEEEEKIKPRVALVLADSEADLHEIIRTHRAGCPDDLLLEIYADQTPMRRRAPSRV